MGEGCGPGAGHLGKLAKEGTATRMKMAGTRLCLAREEAGADVSGGRGRGWRP